MSHALAQASVCCVFIHITSTRLEIDMHGVQLYTLCSLSRAGVNQSASAQPKLSACPMLLSTDMTSVHLTFSSQLSPSHTHREWSSSTAADKDSTFKRFFGHRLTISATGSLEVLRSRLLKVRLSKPKMKRVFSDLHDGDHDVQGDARAAGCRSRSVEPNYRLLTRRAKRIAWIFCFKAFSPGKISYFVHLKHFRVTVRCCGHF